MMTPGLREFVLEAPAEDPGNAAAATSRTTSRTTREKTFPSAQDPQPRPRTPCRGTGRAGPGVHRGRRARRARQRRPAAHLAGYLRLAAVRAGLVLEVEQASRTSRLLLTKTAPAPVLQAEQPVTGWPPRRPATDLPPARSGTRSRR